MAQLSYEEFNNEVDNYSSGDFFDRKTGRIVKFTGPGDNVKVKIVSDLFIKKCTHFKVSELFQEAVYDNIECLATDGSSCPICIKRDKLAELIAKMEDEKQPKKKINRMKYLHTRTKANTKITVQCLVDDPAYPEDQVHVLELTLPTFDKLKKRAIMQKLIVKGGKLADYTKFSFTLTAEKRNSDTTGTKIGGYTVTIGKRETSIALNDAELAILELKTDKGGPYTLEALDGFKRTRQEVNGILDGEKPEKRERKDSDDDKFDSVEESVEPAEKKSRTGKKEESKKTEEEDFTEDWEKDLNEIPVSEDSKETTSTDDEETPDFAIEDFEGGDEGLPEEKIEEIADGDDDEFSDDLDGEPEIEMRKLDYDAAKPLLMKGKTIIKLRDALIKNKQLNKKYSKTEPGVVRKVIAELLKKAEVELPAKDLE